jgi:flagellar assembly factor FliW
MPVINTLMLGNISYEPEAAFQFPRGLPGFEERRSFVAIKLPGSEPLVFVQSLEDPGLCFVTLPVGAVEQDYELEMRDEDLELVGFPAGFQPAIGIDVACLVVIAIRETGPTANLLAPLVLNLRTSKAVQAVVASQQYSHQHALVQEEAAVCS